MTTKHFCALFASNLCRSTLGHIKILISVAFICRLPYVSFSFSFSISISIPAPVSDPKLWFPISHLLFFFCTFWTFPELCFNSELVYAMHLGDVVTAAVIKTCKLYLYPHGKVGPRF